MESHTEEGPYVGTPQPEPGPSVVDNFTSITRAWLVLQQNKDSLARKERGD